MFTFKMYTTLRFNRPIDNSLDWVSFGEIAFKTREKSYRFEFMECESFIDDKDPCLLHTTMSNPDYTDYGCLRDLTESDFASVSEFDEIEIFTCGSPDLIEEGFDDISFESFCVDENGICKRLLMDVEKEVVNVYNNKLEE